MATLEDLGYGPFFDASRKEQGFERVEMARVVAEHRGAYTTTGPRGECLARITGKRMFDASSREDFPAVGDWVVLADSGPGQAVIKGMLARKTVIERRFGDKTKDGNKTDFQIIAANVDVAFVVESADRDYSLNRFERYAALAQGGGVVPVFVLNKIDVLSEEERGSTLAQMHSRFPTIDILGASTTEQGGIEALRAYIKPRMTYCFLGSSGVGKSSLINLLLGGDVAQTGGVGMRSGRGKHTTTRRHMYFLPSGGMVVDNPGVREVGAAGTRAETDGVFEKAAALAGQCKYTDCSHRHQPGCALLAAVQNGELDDEQYQNYLGLKKEAEYFEMTSRQKRQKDRSFGKFIKNAKEEVKKYKP